MVAAQRAKAADKHDVSKKVMSLLKKVYPLPKQVDRPVLETILYAVCLENTTSQIADECYSRLFKSFHDLNEIRVSSMDELEAVFHDVEEKDWRSVRVRNVLQSVFETNYSFDFEQLKRKTLELAVKHLNKIKSLTPFIRGYTLSHSLGAHILPIDDRMLGALIWLELVPPGTTTEHASEALRGSIRKAEGPDFCQQIRALGTDPRFRGVFDAALKSTEPIDDETPVAARLEQLLKKGSFTARAKKGTPKRDADGHASAKKTPGKPAPHKTDHGTRVKSEKKKPASSSDGKKAEKKPKKVTARSSK